MSKEMKEYEKFVLSSSDPRPPRGGWARGSYSCMCLDCKKEFQGDKRSVKCAGCAYNEAALKPEGED